MNLMKDNGADQFDEDIYALLKEGTPSEGRFNFGEKPRLLKVKAATYGSFLVSAVYGKGSSWVPKERVVMV